MAIVPRDMWIGLIMLAFAVLYWREADKIRISPLDGPVGASGLPKTLAWTLGILAVILIARSIAEAMLLRGAAHRGPEAGSREFVKVHLRAVGMLTIGVGYLLIIPVLGYTLSIGLLLGAVSLYIGAPPGLRTMLVAVLGAGFFYLLFVRFLGIPLPHGMLYEMLSGSTGN